MAISDHPDSGEKIQLDMNINEQNGLIAWVDGSADNRTDANPKSGCSVWFGDNWFLSMESPFKRVPDMADITKYTNKYLSSTQIQVSTLVLFA